MVTPMSLQIPWLSNAPIDPMVIQGVDANVKVKPWGLWGQWITMGFVGSMDNHRNHGVIQLLTKWGPMGLPLAPLASFDPLGWYAVLYRTL